MILGIVKVGTDGTWSDGDVIVVYLMVSKRMLLGQSKQCRAHQLVEIEDSDLQRRLLELVDFFGDQQEHPKITYPYVRRELNGEVTLNSSVQIDWSDLSAERRAGMADRDVLEPMLEAAEYTRRTKP